MKIWCKKYQNKASCSLYVIPLTKLLYKIVCTFYNHHWEMKSQKYPTCCLMISTTGLWAITQIFFCVLSVAQHSCHTRQAFKGFDRQTKQKKKTTWMWCLCPVKKVKKKQDGEYYSSSSICSSIYLFHVELRRIYISVEIWQNPIIAFLIRQRYDESRGNLLSHRVQLTDFGSSLSLFVWVLQRKRRV